jgi:2-keto-4-pentenoate hydratase/2-oxohepta-3-ene-1,7-dioic acid hydratase in catechol pathway
LKAPSSLIGSGQPILLPRVAPDCVDYEGEVAVVIGRRATDVPAAEAWRYVAGLTICNDVSARDVQQGAHVAGARPNTSMAKSFDTFTPCGPCVATPDEVADPEDVGISTYVDGERRQHARTRQHIWPISEMIAFLSARTTLLPGDVVSTGTPAGVGAPTKRFLRPGNVVRVEVEGVGMLENGVVG